MGRALDMPTLSQEESTALAIRAKDDPAAREELVERALGLLLKLSRRYRTLDRDDAFGEASLAFMEALAEFEPDDGRSFLSWAVGRIHFRLKFVARTSERYARRRVSLDDRAGGTLPDLDMLPAEIGLAYQTGRLSERHVLILKDRLADIPQAETAAELGISTRQLRVALTDALEVLRGS